MPGSGCPATLPRAACGPPAGRKKGKSSRHLCNIVIQKRWRLARGQHPKLPPDLLWSSWLFQLYLQQEGHSETWDKLIIPGMNETEVAARHSTQELMEACKASFELYRADFMLGDYYQPWLLEINTVPSLEQCSAVTRWLCTTIQQDMLHMVLDRKENLACSTGAFKLTCKELLGLHLATCVLYGLATTMVLNGKRFILNFKTSFLHFEAGFLPRPFPPGPRKMQETAFS
ncbi:tubulin monoglycylase TTLL3 [Amazona aestiva]|uniref:Tubulin monoglycylase TTLL3 n=1 Tax=Amazona aestiva TaxID=12930 RepID=A0A0Q3QBT9_AMAAE|nr:tubulin monoglycylase TTLL3 [Amazona aestiva]